jgi:hypothetical protein
MSKTKTVVTTEEVEMVECDSCGQNIEKKEAHYFMIRKLNCKHDCIEQTDGWACEHCVEHPISLPVIYQTLGENTDFGDIALAICAITLTIIFSIVMIAHILLIT